MTGERCEHPLIDSVRLNAPGRYPMPEVRRTPEEELPGPALVAGRMQPIGKLLEVRANWTRPQLTSPELTLNVEF
jgi:hypothetical protein